MGQQIDVTCGAPSCHFSAGSVVIEGPYSLGCHRADGGGKRGLLTWRTEQGTDSLGVGTMCSCGQGSQYRAGLSPTRNHSPRTEERLKERK